MKIVVYADESGTHDPEGEQPGSKYPVIAGFAACRSDWIKFLREWKSILDKYSAPYFHSREWRVAKAAIEHKKKETKELRKNPYYGWGLKRLNDFLSELTKVASSGNKIPIAGAIKIPVFNKIKAALEVNNPEKIQLDPDPYKYCISEFFRVYHHETYLQWGEFKCPVTFFFDYSNDPKWRASVLEVFEAYKKKDSRMEGPSFVDKKKCPHWPLQAADLLAYRIRQLCEDVSNNTLELNASDNVLLNNLLTSGAIKYPELPLR